MNPDRSAVAGCGFGGGWQLTWNEIIFNGHGTCLSWFQWLECGDLQGLLWADYVQFVLCLLQSGPEKHLMPRSDWIAGPSLHLSVSLWAQSTAVNVSCNDTLFFISYILLYCTVLYCTVLLFSFLLSSFPQYFQAFWLKTFFYFFQCFQHSHLNFFCKNFLRLPNCDSAARQLFTSCIGLLRCHACTSSGPELIVVLFDVFCWSQRRKDRNSIMQPGERLLCALLSVDLLGILFACSTSRWR